MGSSLILKMFFKMAFSVSSSESTDEQRISLLKLMELVVSKIFRSPSLPSFVFSNLEKTKNLLLFPAPSKLFEDEPELELQLLSWYLVLGADFLRPNDLVVSFW